MCFMCVWCAYYMFYVYMGQVPEIKLMIMTRNYQKPATVSLALDCWRNLLMQLRSLFRHISLLLAYLGQLEI